MLPDVVGKFLGKHEYIQEMIKALEDESIRLWEETSNLGTNSKENLWTIETLKSSISQRTKHRNTALNYIKTLEDSNIDIGEDVALTYAQGQLNTFQEGEDKIHKRSAEISDRLFNINMAVSSLNYLLNTEVDKEDSYMIDKLTPVYRTILNALTAAQKYVLVCIARNQNIIGFQNNYKTVIISELKKRGLLVPWSTRWKYHINDEKYPFLCKYLQISG